MKWLAGFVLLALTTDALAEVVAAGETGFNLKGSVFSNP